MTSTGFSSLWSDHTFSAAMMHSVGQLGQDEYVDQSGQIHLMSVRHRRQLTVGADGGDVERQQQKQQQQQQPDYGTLEDLFTSPGKATGESGTATTGETELVDEEDEEFEVEDQVEGGSLTAAIFGVVKGTVGPAILYLPRGFKMAGWAVAIPALILATFAYIYSAHRLLACWKVEDDRQRFLAERMDELQGLLMSPAEYRRQSSSNDTNKSNDKAPVPGTPRSVKRELDKFTPKLLTYPELARRAFGSFAFMIEFGIASMQFGVCLTYLIFVPANLYASCQTLFGIAIPKSYFLIAMLLIEIPCSWIRDIRKLTPFNVTATLLIVYGLGSCLVIAAWYSYLEKEDTLLESMAALPAIQPTWFLFIGTAFFVFEGSITLVVPLQEAVYKAEDRAIFPMVNQHVTTTIVAFYIFFAMICWAAFGERVQTALTASLPAGAFSTTVQFAYAIAVILTYPLQAFPAMEVTLRCLSSGPGSHRNGQIKSEQHGSDRENDNDDNGWDHKTRSMIQRNVATTLLNILLGLIAVVAIDYLGNVVSLLGSLVGMPIALVYPPLMHNLLVKNLPWTTRYLNFTVSAVGVFATVAASYATIVNWDEGSE
jgi:solute carrier family 36 (proton-coupled amino acid transporter)